MFKKKKKKTMDKITWIFYFKDNVFFVLKIIKYIIYKYLNISYV